MLHHCHTFRRLSLLLLIFALGALLVACNPVMPTQPAAPAEPATEEPVTAEPATAEPAESPDDESIHQPVGPINLAEGACFDFTGYDDNTELGTDFTLNDIRFTALGGDLVPFVNYSSEIGLQFDPAGIRLDFPMPTNPVLLYVRTDAQPLAVEALAADGSVVDARKVSPDEGTVAVEFGDQDIAAVIITGGGYEGLLVQVCTGVHVENRSDVEVYIPYPPRVEPPIGDATLVPGDEKMRAAVEELAPQLREYGVQINTARTVLLPEDNIKRTGADDVYYENVLLAPIGPTRRLDNAEEVGAALNGVQGAIGVLVLDTSVPDSPLPSGSYVVVVAESGIEGYARYIDAKGETVAEGALVASAQPGNNVPIPIAAIYLGTKYCYVCDRGWCSCTPCDGGMRRKACLALLGQ